MKKVIVTHSVEETKLIAKKLIHELSVGDVVLLSGDLGAGKTTFVGGVMEELGYKDHVISPTFNILKCYFEVTPHIYHIDAYRLEGQNIDIGLEEYIEGDGIAFIEWPKFIEPLIPNKHLNIVITRVDDNTRQIVISSTHPSYERLLNSFEAK